MNRFTLALFLICAAGSARGATWLPVGEAMTAAHQSGKLIVLYLSDGVKDNDEWVEAWSECEGFSVADHVVLARGTSADAILLDYPPLRQYFSRTIRGSKVILRLALVILGPDGDTIFSPASAFRDVAELTAIVKALNLQQPAFLQSAMFLRDGKVTESILAKGQGLLNASQLKAAGEAFVAAAERARVEQNAVLEQVAEIGLARVEIERWQAGPQIVYAPRGHTLAEDEQLTGTSVLQVLDPITAHPASNAIAAQAWYLTGVVRMVMRQGKAAGNAYKSAYGFAEKPSPVAEMARRALDMLGIAVAEETAAGPGSVHLAMPRREVMAGTIEVVATAPGAARVEFLLDDARVTERTSAPFAAPISLGTLPRAHTIKAVAYDGRGGRLGEDAATVNDRVSSLSVHIVEPRGDIIVSRAVVVLQARVPGGLELRSVDLYWNEKKLATMTAPPFRYQLELPVRNASGYLRAVATDAGGGVAEDTKLINSRGLSDSARIDAVELYAIVQDPSGHRIEGLTAADFVVKEDGRPMKIELHNASTDPITVGVAVDTSGSMRVSMTAVIDYVNEFVHDSLAEKDQTLLIAFDEQPHVLQRLTSDLQHVSSDLSTVDPSGQTAVWDSIIFALQELRAARGKRALLVFTDGNDNASRTDPGAAIQIAHETGVPVYVVLTYSGDPSVTFDASGHPGLRQDSGAGSLEELAGTTGGTVFRFPRRADLPRLFAQVRDDTRSEYLITYVSPSKKPASEMRKISIAVPSRRAVVRSMTGYYRGQ